MLRTRFKVPIPRRVQPAPVLNEELTLCARFIEADGLGSIGLRYALALNELGARFGIWPTTRHAESVPAEHWRLLCEKMQHGVGGRVVAIADEDEAFRHCPGGARRFRVAMYEATELPPNWVHGFNHDRGCTLLVPDPWVRQVFLDSGVQAPIKVVPLGVDPAEPCSRAADRPFTFGMTANFEERKNHVLLIEAFRAAFSRQADVRLHLHGRNGHLEPAVREAAAGDDRIAVVSRPLSKVEFDEWWSSLDAYVQVSAGEGYSHTPREALMRGIPTAVTDFSAHCTLVQRGTVVPIPTRGLVPAYKHAFGASYGRHALIHRDDVVETLRWMLRNDAALRALGRRGREQVLALDTWKQSTLLLLAATAQSH